MLIQEKDMSHECKETPNSPPKSVLNETLQIVKWFKIKNRYISDYYF